MSAVTYHLVAGEGNVDFAVAVAFKEKYALSKSGGPLCAHGVMTVVTPRLFLVFHENFSALEICLLQLLLRWATSVEISSEFSSGLLSLLRHIKLNQLQ
ncbi:hypothetical protein L3X38_009017 [Prunus dulcis]|uniref:Uncharacterized protein n=1 Tax=Prunus dulcis TaxID=3755 RepID=A0AAD4ZXG9_PRUDU|nr:hypothetical protein L3X38_009017 [Prunus dulcis]